jgi:anti-sigma factor RsiW
MGGVTDHDELRMLLGAYALDAVDPDEAAAVRAHLDECQRCADEVARHHEVASLLANEGGDAPAHLWEEISARIEPGGSGGGIPAGDAFTPFTAPDARPARRTRRTRRPARVVGALLAAAAVVAIAALGVQVGRLDHRVGQLQAAGPQQGLSRAVAAAVADPQARDVTLASTSATPAAVAEVVLLPSGASYAINSGLPAIGSDRTYQLWGKVGSRFVSLGLMGSHPDAIAFRVDPAAPVSLFAVTNERAGGAMQPTAPPVAAGRVLTS